MVLGGLQAVICCYEVDRDKEGRDERKMAAGHSVAERE